MADQFLGEIRMFAGNFAPYQWATCDGQIMAIAQNTALFSLLGTNFGGNGTTNFGLPNLQGRAPLDFGQGPGLTQRNIGDKGGVESVTIDNSTMASHNHGVLGFSGDGDKTTPIGNTWSELGNPRSPTPLYTDDTTHNVGFSVSGKPIVSAVGGGQAHENRQPFLVVTFIIALAGMFPPRG